MELVLVRVYYQIWVTCRYFKYLQICLTKQMRIQCICGEKNLKKNHENVFVELVATKRVTEALLRCVLAHHEGMLHSLALRTR